MTIAVGDSLPDVNFTIMSDDGPAKLSTSDVFAGKSVAVFAVPGAYTPTCHAQHLPGFLAQADALAAKGIDKIACISVNDVFVLDKWAQDTGGKGKIEFLADGSAEFTKATGLELDASGAGLGIRSKRYAMHVVDGVVKVLNVEEVPSVAEASSAEKLLEAL